MSKSAKRYLAMVSDSMSERGPKNETLAEHREHCKAEKGECPFEQRADESDAQVEEGARRSLVTPEEDAAYADAVRRGDRETALRMIRQAAARAMPNTKVVDEDGLPLVVYHGTDNAFTVFDIGQSGVRSHEDWGAGIYITSDFYAAKHYASESFLANGKWGSESDVQWYDDNFDNWMNDKLSKDDYAKFEMLRAQKNKVRFDGNFFENNISKGKAMSLFVNMIRPMRQYVHDGTTDSTASERAKKNGFDGIIIDNGDEIVAFNPTQIKSADITYDDNGNLIPLSKRFNPASADIRDEATGKVRRYLVDAQDTTLKEHDDQYHPDGYDTKTMTCEFRERRAKLDPVDGDVKSGGIKGIFTGSAASYSRPSLIHVGTGEGSQVYGWGLYGSSVRGVAETYANAQKADDDGLLFDGKPFTQNINRYGPFANAKERAMAAVLATNGDLKRARENLEANSFNLFGGINPAGKEALTWFDNNKDRFGEKKSIVYEQSFFTDRDEGDESHLLNWYEPVSDDNLNRVIAQAKKEGIKYDEEDNWLKVPNGGGYWIAQMDKATTGEKLYHELVNILRNPREVSEFLAHADIDGIKYPVDSYGGKDVKDGDKVGWNYVSFRDDNIRMDKIYENGEERPVRDDATGKIRGYLELAQDDSPTAKGANSLP